MFCPKFRFAFPSIWNLLVFHMFFRYLMRKSESKPLLITCRHILTMASWAASVLFIRINKSTNKRLSRKLICAPTCILWLTNTNGQKYVSDVSKNMSRCAPMNSSIPRPKIVCFAILLNVFISMLILFHVNAHDKGGFAMLCVMSFVIVYGWLSWLCFIVS